MIAGSIQIDAAVRDELIHTAIEVVRELRKQVGCTHVALSADLENPALLHLLQIWDSEAALAQSLRAPEIDAIRDHAGKLGLREMAILKYDVASSGAIGERIEIGVGALLLVLAGTARIDPERRDEVIATAVETMRRTRKRAGCVSFVCSVDLEDPNLLHLFLEWETADGLFELLSPERVARIRQRADLFGVHDVSLQRFEVASVGPLV